MADPFTLIRVVDVESSGIDDPAEMVEVGWTDVRLFPNGWQVESGPHARMVNPGMPISFPAMAVHHISDAEAAAGMDPDEARAMVVKGVDFLCAHNAGFDRRFIRGHNLPWICTFKAARTAWPDLQSHGNGSIRYERGLCLGDERTQPSHRAGPDTWVTAHILLDLLQVYQPETLVEITGKPVLLMKVPFGEHFGKRWSEVPDGYLGWMIRTMADDPKREDVVHTARLERQKRASAALAAAPARPAQAAPVEDPDAWRAQVGRF
jgi:exodeoxyribonuclease X